MKHSGSFFLKFWFCKECVPAQITHTEWFEGETPNPSWCCRIDGWYQLTPHLFCLGNECDWCAVSSTEVVPWWCITVLHRAQILGGIQWCCRPGMGMGMGRGSRSLQPPRACASLPSQKHPRGGSSSGWHGNNSPRWEVRAARQQLLFHLQQLGGWNHLHLLHPEPCVHYKCLFLI